MESLVDNIEGYDRYLVRFANVSQFVRSLRTWWEAPAAQAIARLSAICRRGVAEREDGVAHAETRSRGGGRRCPSRGDAESRRRKTMSITRRREVVEEEDGV